MSMFSLDNVEITSYSDFKSKLNRICHLLINIQPDQSYTKALLSALSESIREYGLFFGSFSTYNFELHSFPELAKVSNTFKEKLRYFGELFIEVSGEFDKVWSKELSLFDTDFKQIHTFQMSLKRFLDSTNKRKSDFNMHPYIVEKEKKEKIESEMESISSKRNLEVKEMIITQNKINECTQKINEYYPDYVLQINRLKEEFHEENGDITSAIDTILNKRFDKNKKIIRKMFEMLQKKLTRFTADISSFRRHLKLDYDPEDDVAFFCSDWLGKEDAKNMYLHESLMETDLEETEQYIEETVNKTSGAISEMISGLFNAQKNFMSLIEEDFTPGENYSLMNKKMFPLIVALRDTFNNYNSVFKSDLKNYDYIMDKSKDFIEKCKEFHSLHPIKLKQIEKVKPKPATQMPEQLNTFVGFDQNFFDALGSSKSSFSLGLIQFKNDKKTADSIFKILKKHLSGPEPGRKNYLRAIEIFINHFIVWQRNIIVDLTDNMYNLACEGKSILVGINMLNENSTSYYGIPTVSEGMINRLNSQLKSKESQQQESKEEDNDKKDDKDNTEPNKEKGNIYKDNIDEKLYERFIGKEEAEKNKGGDDKKDLNFFSFLLENFDEQEEIVFTYDIALNCDKETSTHKLEITPECDATITLLKTPKKKPISFNLKQYKQIKLKSPHKEQYWFKKITMQDKRGNTKIIYLHGDAEDLKRFRSMIFKLFESARIQKDISKGDITYGTIMTVLSKKQPKTSVKITINIYSDNIFRMDKAYYDTRHYEFATNIFNKTLVLKDPRQKADKEFLFKRYLYRDTFMSNDLRIRSEYQNERRQTEEILTKKIWVGVLDMINDTKAKIKNFDRWIVPGKDVYIIALYGAEKSVPKNILIHMNLDTDEKYMQIALHNDESMTLLMIVAEKVKKDVHSIITSDWVTSQSISFGYKDSLCLVLMDMYSSFSRFERTYPSICAYKNHWKPGSIWSSLYMVDHILWITKFEDIRSEKSEDNKELWDKDELSVAIKKGKVFTGFNQAKYKDFEPLNRDKNFYPIRVMWRNSREVNNQLSMKESEIHRNFEQSEVHPVSFSFDFVPRNVPLRYCGVQTECNNTAMRIRVTNITVVSKSPLGSDKPIYLILMHFSSEWCGVSFPSLPFDSQKPGYVWKIENDSISWPEITTYLQNQESEYLLETTLKFMLCGQSGDDLGVGVIKLSNECLKPTGKMNNAKVFSQGIHIATMRTKVFIEIAGETAANKL